MLCFLHFTLQMKLELVKYGDIEVEPINDKQVLVACGAMGW